MDRPSRDVILFAVLTATMATMELPSTETINVDAQLSDIDLCQLELVHIIYVARSLLNLPRKTFNDREAGNAFRTCTTINKIANLIETSLSKQETEVPADEVAVLV